MKTGEGVPMSRRIRTTLIGRPALEIIDASRVDVPDDQPEALLLRRRETLDVLEDEANGLRRIGWGVLCWLAAVAGISGLAAVVWVGAPAWARVVGLVVAVLLLPAAAVVGRSVWSAGREVTDALVWWTTLPARLPDGGVGVDQWRSSPLRDAIEVRVWIWQRKRPLRAALVAVSALAAPVFGVSLQDSPRFGEVTWADGQTAAITIVVLGLLVVGLGTAAIVFGGLQRSLNAAAQRDPVQRRIMAWFGR